MRSSPVMVIFQTVFKIAKLVKKRTDVHEFQRNNSFQFQEILSIHQFIINSSQLILIQIPRSFNASIIYFVSSDSKNHLNLLFQEAKLAKIKSLFVIDLDQGRVMFFI
jgi:hypothetical protein